MGSIFGSGGGSGGKPLGLITNPNDPNSPIFTGPEVIKADPNYVPSTPVQSAPQLTSQPTSTASPTVQINLPSGDMLRPTIPSNIKDILAMSQKPEDILQQYSKNYANGGNVDKEPKQIGIESLFKEFVNNLHDDLKRDEPVKITIMHPQHMASGGHVQTHLTTTVPPQHGPDPYGIASMFKSRYR